MASGVMGIQKLFVIVNLLSFRLDIIVGFIEHAQRNYNIIVEKKKVAFTT